MQHSCTSSAALPVVRSRRLRLHGLEFSCDGAPLCAQLAVSLWPRWGRPDKTLIALALLPAMSLVVALGFGWYDGYWRKSAQC